MSKPAKIGVVTVTYNSSSVLEDFLASVWKQTHADFVLYAVDNASSDGSVARLRRETDSRLVILASETNSGVAAGNNRGIARALADGCDLVLLINNDTEFGPELFATLVRGLDEFACDMSAPKILYADRRTIWCAGGGFNAWKGYAGVHYGAGETDRGQYDRARQVGHAPTCCLLVRREVFERIGMMDARYFVYLDDTDFCFRAMCAGIRLFYLPSAVLFHKVSVLTGGPESPFSVRFCTRNHIYFMLKNLGWARGLYYLPAYQLHLLYKLLARRIDGPGFLLRERAFFEAFGVWRSLHAG